MPQRKETFKEEQPTTTSPGFTSADTTGETSNTKEDQGKIEQENIIEPVASKDGKSDGAVDEKSTTTSPG